jgi:hypothetical protein
MQQIPAIRGRLAADIDHLILDDRHAAFHNRKAIALPPFGGVVVEDACTDD